MIISTTQFKLKKWTLYGQFFIDTYRVVKQVRQAGSVVHMKIKPFSLRTITAWKTQEDMLRFRNHGSHLQAMKKSRSFGQIASVTWESDTIPTWQEAIKKLQDSTNTRQCSGSSSC